MKYEKPVDSRVVTLAKELYSGKTRKDLIQKYSKEFKISVNMVDRILAKAKLLETNRSKAEVATLEKHASEIQQEDLKTVLSIDPKSVLSKAEKRMHLAKIVRGEMLIDDIHFVDYEGRSKQIKIKRHPTHRDIINAIAQDNEMTGDLAPKQTDNRFIGAMQVIVQNETDKGRIDRIGQSA